MLLRRYMAEAGKRLALAGVESPHLCAQTLICRLLGITRLQCIVEAERPLTELQTAELDRLLLRSIGGEPLAYILGQKEFFSRDFHVTPDTLIPRPETELLVETALALLPKANRLFFADIGSGSGCIGITLVLERALWRGLLMDISAKALELARRNARALHADANISCVQADMLLSPLKPCSCDFLVSNPPYIAESETAQVMGEVLRFEPHKALFSASNGIAHLQSVVRTSRTVLKQRGMVFVEHGATQGGRMRAMFEEAGIFGDINTVRDLAGLDRCTYAVKIRP